MLLLEFKFYFHDTSLHSQFLLPKWEVTESYWSAGAWEATWLFHTKKYPRYLPQATGIQDAYFWSYRWVSLPQAWHCSHGTSTTQQHYYVVWNPPLDMFHFFMEVEFIWRFQDNLTRHVKEACRTGMVGPQNRDFSDQKSNITPPSLLLISRSESCTCCSCHCCCGWNPATMGDEVVVCAQVTCSGSDDTRHWHSTLYRQDAADLCLQLVF